MENEHVIAGLIRKRADLAGQLEAAQASVRQLIIDLDNVDATIRLFQPDIDLAEIKPKPLPPRHMAFRGEISRAILTALRETALPMTRRDLTLRCMEERSLSTADSRLVRTVQNRIGAALRHMRGRGMVTSRREGRDKTLWSLPDA